MTTIPLPLISKNKNNAKMMSLKISSLLFTAFVISNIEINKSIQYENVRSAARKQLVKQLLNKKYVKWNIKKHFLCACSVHTSWSDLTFTHYQHC